MRDCAAIRLGGSAHLFDDFATKLTVTNHVYGITRRGFVRSGIIAFQFQMSDDGASALVELVAADKTALNAVLSATDVRVKTFERGKAPRAAIEAEFRLYKKNFSLETFRPVRVQ